jgi:hypothetical protein
VFLSLNPPKAPIPEPMPYLLPAFPTLSSFRKSDPSDEPFPPNSLSSNSSAVSPLPVQQQIESNKHINSSLIENFLTSIRQTSRMKPMEINGFHQQMKVKRPRSAAILFVSGYNRWARARASEQN